MKLQTYFMIIGLGIIILAYATMHNDPTVATLAFAGFFGMPRNEGTRSIASAQELEIKTLGAEIYSLLCDLRTLGKMANLLNSKKQDIISNNQEFETAAFSSETNKIDKIIQIFFIPLGAIVVDYFLINDTFRDEISNASQSVIPVGIIISGIAFVLLALEFAAARVIDSSTAKESFAQNFKYVFIIIPPAFAFNSFYNDYTNGLGNMGSLVFFSSMTIVSILTHYLVIKKSSEFMSLLGFIQVNSKIAKLKKDFDPLASKSIEIETNIEKKLGLLYTKICDFQQDNPDDKKNFLILIPGQLREYFNKLMGQNVMPLPPNYVPSNGWSQSLYDHLANDNTTKELPNNQGTTNPNSNTEAGRQQGGENNNGGNENKPNNDPFTDFFGGEKRV